MGSGHKKNTQMNADVKEFIARAEKGLTPFSDFYVGISPMVERDSDFDDRELLELINKIAFATLKSGQFDFPVNKPMIALLQKLRGKMIFDKQSGKFNERAENSGVLRFSKALGERALELSDARREKAAEKIAEKEEASDKHTAATWGGSGYISHKDKLNMFSGMKDLALLSVWREAALSFEKGARYQGEFDSFMVDSSADDEKPSIMDDVKNFFTGIKYLVISALGIVGVLALVAGAYLGWLVIETQYKRLIGAGDTGKAQYAETELQAHCEELKAAGRIPLEERARCAKYLMPSKQLKK